MNVTPAGLDWFEDHSAIMSNLTLAASLARTGGGPGILFDIEPYHVLLWDYRTQLQHGARPWSEVAAQVRARGREALAILVPREHSVAQAEVPAAGPLAKVAGPPPKMA